MSFPSLLVVIHETIISAQQSLAFHADPTYLGSYHAVIEINGNINYLVPAEHKAFAARESSYLDPITKELEHINNSVDDFAYHIALETPIDGRNSSKKQHAGYSIQQYKSLAWLCVATGVQPNRITTHGEIKTPKTTEPRCFNLDLFETLYEQQRSIGKKILNMGVLDNVR